MYARTQCTLYKLGKGVLLNNKVHTHTCSHNFILIPDVGYSTERPKCEVKHMHVHVHTHTHTHTNMDGRVDMTIDCENMAGARVE